ncbi:hypothetical protein LTR95_000780 [Oleoguttula sp. CCFEE 5521]
MEYSDGYSNQGYLQDYGNYGYEQHYSMNYDQGMASSMPDLHSNMYNTQGAGHLPCDIKPRLTKEQHDILETHFQSQPKPNTSVKKGFADSLNVSLDKVNNWFQNRRAKSKQDAKKQSGSIHVLNVQPGGHRFSMSGSDSDSSPAFAPADYYDMMHRVAEDEVNVHGLPQQGYYQEPYGRYHPEVSMPVHAYPQQQSLCPPGQGDMFDSPQEMNRRTMTQEQFDAMSQPQPQSIPHEIAMPEGLGDFGGLGVEFDSFNGFFSEQSHNEPKVQDVFTFPVHGTMPMTSHDSSVPSTISEGSAMSFPSSHMMQEHARFPSSGSDWTDSRSSSMSLPNHEEHFAQPMAVPRPQVPVSQVPASSSRWQPGQSVPVDITQLSQQFQQAAHARQSSQHLYQAEQPLAWPNDEMYANAQNQAQTHMITQSMSHVGIDTPVPQQHATFKSPTPASSLASRRQRARPAPLGLASLRSQSYSGSQPGSPAPLAQPPQVASPGPTVRRIKSSNVMHNTVTGSRIQKQIPGSAQRSPLNFTFKDAMNSPKAMRHMQLPTGPTLAPPTPMSPREMPRPELLRHFPQGQNVAGSAPDAGNIEQGESKPVTSPPHTPLHPPQPQFARRRVGSNVITENTPPQSAPASQSTFPTTFATAAPQPQIKPPPPQQAMQHTFSVTLEPQQPSQPAPQPQHNHPHFTLTPSDAPFSYGIPVLDPTTGQIILALPAPHQPNAFIAYPQPYPTAPAHLHSQTPPSGMQQYPFPISHSPSPQPQPQKQQELFVHEYQPPEDIKRAATPRRAGSGVEGGAPRNWTFTNQGPGDFEKKKAASAAAGSVSPAEAST